MLIRHRARPYVLFCSFGDMLRVPVSSPTCSCSSRGADCARLLLAVGLLKICARHPDKKVVVPSSPNRIETTARATRCRLARRTNRASRNFSVLVSLCCSAGDGIGSSLRRPLKTACRAFRAGPRLHGRRTTGYNHACRSLSRAHFVTGFEPPLESARGRAHDTVRQLEAGTYEVQTISRVVKTRGQPRRARSRRQSFEVSTATGASSLLPKSGYRLR